MTHDEFIGAVQDRAELPSRGDAEVVTRASLEVLATRLIGGLPSNLAGQLPAEIGRHLEREEGAGDGVDFGLVGYFDRVAAETGAELEETIDQARAVISVLGEAVGAGPIEKARAQLPDEFEPLFGSDDGRRVGDGDRATAAGARS